jgi:NADH-quinone oxidoreductase subunit J
LGGLAIAAAVGMIFSRNALYAALLLVVNFLMVAGLYFFLGAPFLALAQISVYAGAIMILFLFVIMLLGGEKLPMGEAVRGQRWVAIVIGAALMAELFLLLVVRGGVLTPMPVPTMDTSPAAVGMLLFQKYNLPFEITSAILLVALIGAIVLTKKEGRSD